MKHSHLFLIALVLPLFAGCGSDEEYTCVCTNTITGSEIDRTKVSAGDVNEAQEICDDRESIAYPDRCVIVE